MQGSFYMNKRLFNWDFDKIPELGSKPGEPVLSGSLNWEKAVVLFSFGTVTPANTMPWVKKKKRGFVNFL